jgi:hypothetical protein
MESWSDIYVGLSSAINGKKTLLIISFAMEWKIKMCFLVPNKERGV